MTFCGFDFFDGTDLLQYVCQGNDFEFCFLFQCLTWIETRSDPAIRGDFLCLRSRSVFAQKYF